MDQEEYCYLNTIPAELREEIASRIYFLGLSALEMTSKFWRDEIRRMNLWPKIYENFTLNGGDINRNNIPINYLWYMNLQHAIISPMLNSKQLKKINSDVQYSLRMSYKSLLQAIMLYKPFMKKDLDAIERQQDLTDTQKAIALKFYWYCHMKHTNIRVPLFEAWSPELIQNAPNEIALLVQIRPVLFWKTSAINYYVQQAETAIVALWVDENSPSSATLFYGKYRTVNSTSVTWRVLYAASGPLNEIVKKFKFKDKQAEHWNNTVLRSHFFSQEMYSKNDDKYIEMENKYENILEACAANVIESVKVSNFGVKNLDFLNTIKHYCDKWHQNSENFSHSKLAKIAIIRALRRVTRYFLTDEILTHSVWGGVFSKHWNDFTVAQIERYVKYRPTEETPVEKIHPKYWPFYLLEKACFIAEPLSKLLLELLKSTSETINNNEILTHKKVLQYLGVDLLHIDQVINEFKEIDSITMNHNKTC